MSIFNKVDLTFRGLTRRPDRRRKLVALTAEGKEAAQRALRIKREPPPGFASLSAAELDTLEELMRRLTGGAPGAAGERDAGGPAGA